MLETQLARYSLGLNYNPLDPRTLCSQTTFYPFPRTSRRNNPPPPCLGAPFTFPFFRHTWRNGPLLRLFPVLRAPRPLERPRCFLLIFFFSGYGGFVVPPPGVFRCFPEPDSASRLSLSSHNFFFFSLNRPAGTHISFPPFWKCPVFAFIRGGEFLFTAKRFSSGCVFFSIR